MDADKRRQVLFSGRSVQGKTEALRANMSNCFDRGANDNFLFVCGNQRASAVEKKSENREVIFTADGRRWTQIHTDGFFFLEDLSREKPEALRAKKIK